MPFLRLGAVAALLIVASCGGVSHYPEGRRAPYGQCCVPYGDGLNPEIALMADIGTPVIAPADGVVASIRPNTQFGGVSVRVAHGDRFDNYYTHLSAVHVAQGQAVKRGELIGLSGSDHTSSQYLHFSVCRKGGSCLQSAETFDPRGYWLEGSARCFEPGRDYAKVPAELTLPLACGDHARTILAEIRAKKPA
jgi:murein DD-endopeptidase MepM/ murein hydrolase activator NlpD